MTTKTKNPKTYAKLEPLQKVICQLLALGGESVPLSELGRAVKQSLSLLADQGLETPAKLVNGDVERIAIGLGREGFIRIELGKKFSATQTLRDRITQDTVRQGRLESLAELIRECETASQVSFGDRTSRRDMRIAFYQGDMEAYREASKPHGFQQRRTEFQELGVLEPFDSATYAMLPPPMHEIFWTETTVRGIAEAKLTPAATEQFLQWVRSQPVSHPCSMLLASEVHFAMGNREALEPLAELLGKLRPSLLGLSQLLAGDRDAALASLGRRAQAKGSSKSGDDPLKKPLTQIFFALLLMAQSDSKSSDLAFKVVSKMSKQTDSPFTRAAGLVAKGAAFQSKPVDSDQLKSVLKRAERTPLEHLIASYVWTLCFDRQSDPLPFSGLMATAKRFAKANLDFLAAETYTFDALSINGDAAKSSEAAAALYAEIGCQRFAGSYEPISPWKATLDALSGLVGQPNESKQRRCSDVNVIGQERMAWILEYASRGSSLDVRPLIQVFGKSGWSKGRPVALLRLFNEWQRSDFDFLSDEDKQICKTLNCDASRDRYGYTEYHCYFEDEKLVPAITGHPRLFSEKDRETPIEVACESPRLVIEQLADGNVSASLLPELKRKDDTFTIVKEGTHRLTITRFDAKQQQLSQLLQKGLVVPASATSQLMATAQSLARIAPVHSQIETDSDVGNARSVTSDPSLHVHLMPYESGLQLQFFVRPFGDVGGFFSPGEGTQTVVAVIDSQTQSTRRDLAAESDGVRRLVADCDFLVDQNTFGVVYLPTADEALEALMQLQVQADRSQLSLHWPRGKAFEIAGTADASQFHLKIKQDRDWFAASGKLVVDDALTVEMMELFNRTVESQSRFVQLADGRFLALTDHFRRRIEAMSAYSDWSKGQARFPGIRATAIAELADESQLETDSHWKTQLKKIRDADNIRPSVPKTFAGELRDYQIDGFKWLCRLAHWGAGACLADDMGLGKTLQAIALLIARSGKGPALVVAPTSVAFNWVSEIQRFAPTLRPLLFSEGDRQSSIENLQPRDVLICSYGLLTTESELIQSRVWPTVVLDEAQAIKNASTRRSESAMALNADFRVVLTGTPMENHLGELWNLFQFINPGLLGSDASFQQRFAIPIERDQSVEARRQLKNLIQPFILRRTKPQVLDELPSRTEITVKVQLGKTETAMYEALRQTAIKNLSDKDDDRPLHLRILAELMRMRRFCCHPDLVAPDAGLEAAKLAVFRDTIASLIDGGHKVLVFSQFVDHLHILRGVLEEMKIPYQYLDGSTPVKKRKSSVESFQAGEGDVFLISLRAGGVGLNLTAADYVIHMDPWWNPAVEDQASDRAHRIGQQRPVTIYRLITEGTIEERILELHATKRDLADSLLEGTESSAKLSTKELLKLIQQ